MKKGALTTLFVLAIIAMSSMILSGCDKCRGFEQSGSLHYYNVSITPNSSFEYDLEQLEYLKDTSSISYDSIGFVMSYWPYFYNQNGGIDAYVEFDPDFECFNQQQFKKIEIWSNSDYDDNHIAGDNLVDIFSVIPKGETTAISIEEFLLKEDNGNKSVFILNSPPQIDSTHEFRFLFILGDEIGRIAGFSSITFNK